MSEIREGDEVVVEATGERRLVVEVLEVEGEPMYRLPGHPGTYRRDQLVFPVPLSFGSSDREAADPGNRRAFDEGASDGGRGR